MSFVQQQLEQTSLQLVSAVADASSSASALAAERARAETLQRQLAAAAAERKELAARLAAAQIEAAGSVQVGTGLGRTHCFHHEDLIVGVLPDAHTNLQYRSYKAMVPSCPVPDCVVPPRRHLSPELLAPSLPAPAQLAPPPTLYLPALLPGTFEPGRQRRQQQQAWPLWPRPRIRQPLSPIRADSGGAGDCFDAGGGCTLRGTGWAGGSDVQQVLGSHLGHTWVHTWVTLGSHLDHTLRACEQGVLSLDANDRFQSPSSSRYHI